MPVVPFGEWKPDVTDYRGQHSRTITNVVPQGDGYGPFKALLAASDALPGACRGMFFARNQDGTVSIFAATATKLYLLSNTDYSWTDVSAGGGSYTSVASNAQWQFAQFNNYVFATQANDDVQVYNLSDPQPSAFADLGGSPPRAAYISVVNRFLVLSGITSPNGTRVQWSGLDATTTWTSGVNLSDFQDLPDGGTVRGVSGGEFGYIFQDASIRRMIFAPGSPYVFGIDRVSSDDGLLGPYSLIQAGDRVFFCSPQGFKMIAAGGYPTPIGKEKIDRTFLTDYDGDHPEFFIGSHDPRSQRVFWAYKSVNTSQSAFDRILCYDWALDRWTRIEQAGQYLTSLSRPGLTLEGMDAAFGSNMDVIDDVLGSLDDISLAARARLAGVTTDNKLGFFEGNNLEATLITAEQGDDFKRARVRGLRPVSDASDVACSVQIRDRLQDTATSSDETTINDVGVCEQNFTGRYFRAVARIPEGSDWTFISGVEPDLVPVGKR